MNAVQPRRRCTRLSNNYNLNNTTISNPSTTGDGSYPVCYNNFSQNESRIIYERPDVRLRPLAFFDLRDELIRPAGLMSDGVVGRVNESSIEFKLTIDQADMVAMDPIRKQILLRFCYLDSSADQDDNFPPDVSVLVNKSNVLLPPAMSNPNKPNIPPKRPGQHINITSLCKLCPFVQNSVEIKWYVDPLEPMRSYVITVIIAEKVETDLLLQRIRSRGLSDPEMTKKLILDSDNEVATTNLQSSLLCPLGKMRMSMPCKSTTCHHITCFDAVLYLQMNERKASWTCPVCYKPAYFPDLMIDGFFMDILNKTAPNITEVTLNTDGSWSPIAKLEMPTSAKNPIPEIITISDDEDV